VHETVQTVFTIMDEAYPELKDSSAFILNVVKNEEEKFLETLDTGMKLLEATIQDIEAGESEINSLKPSTIPGDVIFKLYDTFGFPVDIIADHVKEMNIALDLDGFDRAMAEQKARSRSIKKFAGVGVAYKALTSKGIKTSFEGYDTIEGESDVLIIVQDDKEIETAKQGDIIEEIETAKQGDIIEIVTASTVFYAESGGQAGDAGEFENETCVITITDTVKDPTGLAIHKGMVEKGEVKKGDIFTLKVDAQKRQNTAVNHTATHILHSALRKALGDHIKQAGSLVTDTRLRFDFTHFSSISIQDIQAIENEVNLRIRENHSIETEEMNMDEAVKAGATALEGGIASGVRRIEAVTGQAGLDYIHKEQALVESAADLLKGAKEDVKG